MLKIAFLGFGLLLATAASAASPSPSAATPHQCINCTSTPDEVAAHAREMATMCRTADGKPLSGPDIEQGRFPDDTNFWAINEATFQCDGAWSLFSTNHGAAVIVFVASSEGRASEAFNHSAFGFTLERQGDLAKIWVGVGGPLCGQKGTEGLSTAEMKPCERLLRWDATTKKLDFAPLNEIRPVKLSDQTYAEQIEQSTKINYGYGAELESKRSDQINLYWKDKAPQIDWKAPVSKRGQIYNWPIASPDGRHLMISLLDSPSICNSNCPARIFNAQHHIVMNLSVCADKSRHALSSDSKTLIACGERFPIPQLDERSALLENTPPGVNPEAYLEVQRRARATPVNAPQPIRVDSAIHNKSQMLISEWKNGTVEITYDVPKSGLAVAPGTLLFRGTHNGAQYQGTAYIFRNGCRPAPYEVKGYRDTRRELIVLNGIPPQRGQGCEIIGTSNRPENSRLEFDTREQGDL